MGINNLTVITSINYRGIHVDFFDDPNGNQVYTYWEGRALYFGAYNTNYEDEMRKIIDLRLDTICLFEKYPQARLTYFDNNGFRDIKLTYNKRCIKIYLVDITNFNKIEIMQDAKLTLETLYNSEATDK